MFSPESVASIVCFDGYPGSTRTTGAISRERVYRVALSSQLALSFTITNSRRTANPFQLSAHLPELTSHRSAPIVVTTTIGADPY